MNSHAPLLRRQLSSSDNSLVSPTDVDAALDRARRGLAPRCRLEVAAARVYLGPDDSSVPPIEALPLRPTTLARALGYVSDRRRVRTAAGAALDSERMMRQRPRLGLLPKPGRRPQGASPLGPCPEAAPHAA